MNKLRITLSIMCLFFIHSLLAQNTTKITLNLTIPEGIDINKIEPTLPPLKFNKKIIFSFTMDDCPKSAYNQAFTYINGKWMDDSEKYHHGGSPTTGYTPDRTLGYTDGCGNERRFGFGLAIWPNSGSEQTPQYMESIAYLKWTDLPPMLDFGSSLYFHDMNDKVWDNTDKESIILGLKENQKKVIEKMGRGMKVLMRPNGNDAYVDAGMKYSDIVMIGTEKWDNQYMHYPNQSSFNLTKAIQSRDQVTGEDIQKSDPFGKIKKSHDENGLWVHYFSHGAGTDHLSFFDKINDTYGKGGDDSMWFATLDEVYEYWYMKKNITLTKKISGRTLTIEMQVPTQQYFYFKDFSLLLSGITTTNGLNVKASDNVYGLSYAVNGNNSLLVNVDFNQSLKDKVEKYIKLYKQSQKPEDKKDALYFISQLKKDLKDSYMAELGLPASDDLEQKSANIRSLKYNDYFMYGSNMGYLNNNWTDQDVADILTGNDKKNREGVGVNSLRPALYEYFVEKYGYDIRVDAFKHYEKQGARNNVVFIGDKPSAEHREKKIYTDDGQPSHSYETIYEPIWDNGENGTPVNDKNHYALYVYKVVQKYGPYVKFWEIKNEPDYTLATSVANAKRGVAGNWWENDPTPRALKNWAAPIQSYIRMLRVSYEVIKYVDPNAFVCIGGIGYPSFLDAVLRNTDNPDGGKVTKEYPLKGGAWFDCLSFHNYPMYSLSKWVGNVPGNINNREYFRHTDKAAQVIIDHKNTFSDILIEYGYDGKKYPEKEFIITETNIPNKQVKDYIGSEQAQRDYLVKMAVLAQKNKLCGVYIYGPWDDKEASDNGNEYNYKGLYKPIPLSPGAGALRVHESGIAWRTMSRLLAERKYNESEVAKLNLPNGVDGGAFYSSKTKDYIYVLWAKTSEDMNENVTATYSFPASMNVNKLLVTSWDEKENIITGNTINLTSTPVYIKLNAALTVPVAVTGVSLDPTAIVMAMRKSQQLTATVTPADAKNKNVVWSSANPDIASVDQLGKVSAVSPGETTVTVKTVDGNKTATCKVNIRPDSVALSYIQLNPALLNNMMVGDVSQLTVTFFPSNATNQKITWSSSDNNIVSVDETGKIVALATGKTTVVASPVEGDGKKAKYSTITVKDGILVTDISLNTTSKELKAGETLQLTATVEPAKATNKNVVWSSSNTAVATVDASGKVTAIAGGTATITVTSVNGGKTATCQITVKATTIALIGITLTPDKKDVNVGDFSHIRVTFNPANATNKKLTWSVDIDSIASVDENGVVTALKEGIVTVTATPEDGGKAKAKSCIIYIDEGISIIHVTDVSLDHQEETLNPGETLKLTATINPADAANKNLIWLSNNPAIASVDASGNVTAYTSGIAVITVKTEDGGKTATCRIVVNGSGQIPVSSVSLNHTSKELASGNSFQLLATINPANAANKNVTWTSNNLVVASVDKFGFVTAHLPGTAIITVTTESEKKTASCTVTVKNSTGIENIHITKTAILPNPSSGNFKLQFEIKKPEPIQIDLYSSAGFIVEQLLPRQTLEAGQHTISFLLNLQQGTYILVIKGDNVYIPQKLIIN